MGSSPINNVPLSVYTSTERTNMKAKKVNFFELTAGAPVFEDGITSSGDYIDYVRYLDYLESKIGTEFMGLLTRGTKILYTNAGISTLQELVD